MRLPEVLWRIGQKARVWSDYGRRLVRDTREAPTEAVEAFLREENRLLYPATGSDPPVLTIFDLDFPLDYSFDWHRDEYTGRTAPRTFAPILDTRNPEKVGDIKYSWKIIRYPR